MVYSPNPTISHNFVLSVETQRAITLAFIMSKHSSLVNSSMLLILISILLTFTLYINIDFYYNIVKNGIK